MKLVPETPKLEGLVARTLFVVPQYFQREYTWERDSWQDLWSDLLRARDAQIEHFMGLIVFSTSYTDEPLPEGPSLGESVFIIDGQQRLVTLTILAACLYRAIDVSNGPLHAVREALGRLISLSTVADTVNTPRLRLSNSTSQEVLRAITDLDSPLVKAQGRTRPVSAKRVYGAYEFFSRQIEGAAGRAPILGDSPEIKGIYTALTDRLQFLVIRLPNEGDAFVFFESLNARGTDLTQADLVKNLLMLQAKHLAEAP